MHCPQLAADQPTPMHCRCCRDQRVYAQQLPEPGTAGGTAAAPLPPTALTDGSSQQRFADYIHDTRRARLIAVCEDHSGQEGSEAVNYLAAIGGWCGLFSPPAIFCYFFLVWPLKPVM